MGRSALPRAEVEADWLDEIVDRFENNVYHLSMFFFSSWI